MMEAWAAMLAPTCLAAAADMMREVHEIRGGVGGSCDDEVPLSTIMERLKRTGKERREAEETVTVESTQGSIQSAGRFFQSSFVKMDMRKEPFEVQSGPVILAADVVRIGDTQYRQK